MALSIKKLLAFGKKDIRVGFSATKKHQINESTKHVHKMLGIKKNSDPLSMAVLAMILNNGFYNKLFNKIVPGRPFMFRAHEKIKRNIKIWLLEALMQADPALYLSMKIKFVIQESILEGGYAENTEFTQFAKGSNIPLVDSAELLNSVEILS